MRLFQLVIALVLSACASDLPVNGHGPSAIGLVVTPAADSVQIAAELQFAARIAWSDGKEHNAAVTYSATGGVISAAGLYRAGRSPGQYQVIAVCSCGLVDTSAVVILPPHATGLVLLPATATLDTAATMQFQSVVTWSDSADHPAMLAWSATGGTISDSGLYRAGTAPGPFQVVTTCACGLADTSVVTISTNALPPAVFASLSLGIAGLPPGVHAQVTVSGPASFSRSITASAAFDSLAPGDYTVEAAVVTAGANSYTPTPASQTVRLKAGSPKLLQVDYRVNPPTGLPAHPRVWMTPDRITRLRAQASAGTVRWQRVKALADAQLALGAATSSDDLIAIPSICAAYLGTGDARYTQRAGVILTALAVDTYDLKYDSGYPYRFEYPLFTIGLDWCYDGLSVGLHHQVATWLMNRADWVWLETNPARAGAWAINSPDNNYWWGFMMTGPAALAAAGDDTLPGNRPAAHQTLALTKWTTIAKPYFATDGLGGAWNEGTGYDSSWYVGRFADAFLTAGMPVSDPFLEASIRWRLAATMPGYGNKIPFGDQARVSDAPLFIYDRVSMLTTLPPAGAPALLASQVQAWLDQIGQVPTSEVGQTMALVDELVRYDPAAPAAADLSALPKDYYAPGSGYFVYRQSWSDPKSTVFAFESGPSPGHAARDANGMMIWKGSFWISASANIYSHSGIEGGTQNYNNLTVGDFRQVLYDGNGGSIPVAPQVSDQLVVVRGQAKLGYGYPNGVSYGRTVVSDYLRTVAYLPQQDVFVIVDRATVFNPALAKVWRWQMKDVPQVSGNTFRLQSPSADYRCFGSVLAPGDVVLGTESYALDIGTGVSSSAVTVSMSGRASDVVVTVLQCTSDQSAPYTPTATVSASEVAVTIAGRRVVVPLSEAQPVRIE